MPGWRTCYPSLHDRRERAGAAQVLVIRLSTLPYASKVKAMFQGKETFVAHSCGHDLHMAAWVGVARTLAALKGEWKGMLMFVAQPAEETLGGAKAMLADGLFTRFPKPDAAFALHTWPMAYGEVGFNSGPVTSNADAFEAVFRGRGAHGSAPDKAIDPVLIASRFVVDVQGGHVGRVDVGLGVGVSLAVERHQAVINQPLALLAATQSLGLQIFEQIHRNTPAYMAT